MKDMKEEINEIIGQSENKELEYKAVLPPPRTIAKVISAFANTEGGYLIIGISNRNSKIEIKGLEKDIKAIQITEKSLELLSNKPEVEYQYINYKGSNIFVIKVYKSDNLISFENRIFKRERDTVKKGELEHEVNNKNFSDIKKICNKINESIQQSTSAKNQVLEHYKSILEITNSCSAILCPLDSKSKRDNPKGKILLRLLFSSIADNFEIYLANLIYEIYLACPNTLVSNGQVTVQEVLSCSDMNEFINFVAQKKIEKLNRGSIETFIGDNKSIKIFEVLNDCEKCEIKNILQIRHLFTHKNGIIDKKFLKYTNESLIENKEYFISVSELCEKIGLLIDLINKLDYEAVKIYSLSLYN